MTTKFFVEAGGAFVGAFVGGAEPPAGSIEVSAPPADGRQIWSGSQWLPLSDAERAAAIVLRRAAFLMAIDAALGLANAPGAPDPADHIIATIQASGGALGAAERPAILLVRYAGEFHRDDPAAPGLMNAVGALLGLSPAQIDALFIAAAG